MTIRIVLAEDSTLLREGMRTLLAAQDDLELVAACPDLASLIVAMDTLAPDVVLTDIRMPPGHSDEGVQAAEHARVHQPEAGVILLSQYVDLSYVHTLLLQGTDGRGYLLKERIADVGELIAAIRQVAAGGAVIDPKVVEALVRARGRGGDPGLSRLTDRERQVLRQMAQGHNNAAIAESLFITGRAVEKHINSIFAKLGVGQDDGAHPRVKAVLLYLSGSAGSST